MYEHNFGEDLALTQGLSAACRLELQAAGTIVHAQRKTLLFRQGDNADAVFLLNRGSVKSTSINPYGEETLLRVHLPGGILGLTALRERGIRDATAIMLTDGELIEIPRCEMVAQMERNAKLGIWISEIFLHRLCSFHARVSQFLTDSVEQRVARVLLILYGPGTDTDPLLARDGGLSHEELSQIVAARRQTVTISLNRFAEAGFIKVGRRQIQIENPDALRRIANAKNL